MSNLLIEWFQQNYAIYVSVLFVWYVCYWIISYFFMYEMMRGGIFLPLYTLYDDILLQFPGQKGKRIIKTSPDLPGCTYIFCNFKGHFTGKQLQENPKLSQEIGEKMYPGWFHCLVVTFPILFPIYLCAWKVMLH